MQIRTLNAIIHTEDAVWKLTRACVTRTGAVRTVSLIHVASAVDVSLRPVQYQSLRGLREWKETKTIELTRMAITLLTEVPVNFDWNDRKAGLSTLSIYTKLLLIKCMQIHGQ